MSEQNIIALPGDSRHGFDADYWNNRWQSSRTGWDIGYASPTIVHYMATYSDKEARILIPGCGNAYEAVWLAQNGFTHIIVLDISSTAIDKAKELAKAHMSINFVCADFFDFKGTFDLILEQTFFCAIPIDKRSLYCQQSAALLADGGRLVGVLFDREFNAEGPPFGGSAAEYKELFSAHFDFVHFEPCNNSIDARKGTELFIDLLKK